MTSKVLEMQRRASSYDSKAPRTDSCGTHLEGSQKNRSFRQIVPLQNRPVSPVSSISAYEA